MRISISVLAMALVLVGGTGCGLTAAAATSTNASASASANASNASLGFGVEVGAVIVPPAAVEPARLHVPLDALGGEDELPALTRELVRALLGDRVLVRSRLGNVGRRRLEAFMEQQLRTLVGATVEGETIEQAEILWEVRPGHAEFEAASAAIDRVLTRRGIDDATRSTLEDALFGSESTQSADLTRMMALIHRAAVGLACGEGQISTRPLETDDHRIVTGCGRTAIYDYATDGAPLSWRREPTP